ncbi:A disintegrin and metalloproteinase with thrombospondin motifs 17 [Crenichthys baileyi]|uniref:A disintegrin and metalloproteinase with thrombospondin motifs 17 n=1 Tax=Crenichthys baileyi TaxID=28760 RepID=A0AAV9RVA3_9TELE
MNLHKTYTLETVVVADFDMVQYHGAEVAQRFLLTIMNMVDNMFQHGSLGVKVDIRVSKLVLLHTRPEKLKISHHGQRSLESFCQWQYQEFGIPQYLGTNRITSGRYDVPPVDTAVLVTRTDFCVHKNEPCDTVGMAYLSGACSAKRKCVLAEDNGLNLAFTIAHELGHNMGMSHDDDHANCTSHSHIMSGEWVKGRNPNNLSWSSCSRNDLQNFLRSGASICLRYTDPRSRPWMRLSSKLPGMHYSVDEQCQILFGTNATFCTEMAHLMCAGLWCLVDGDPSCKTKLDPPLEGTECGTDKWCRGGQCVSKGPIPQHVDGDWSPWNQWSMCSRTCGTGVQFRQRKCDNPPPGPDGRHCPEASVEHKACQGQPCPKGAPSLRDLQCLDQHDSKRQSRLLTAFVIDDTIPPASPLRSGGKNKARACFCLETGALCSRHKGSSPTKRKAVTYKEEAGQIFKGFHASAFGARGGNVKTRDAITSSFYWPDMSKNIDKWITQCLQCQKSAVSIKQQTQPIPIALNRRRCSVRYKKVRRFIYRRKTLPTFRRR